MDERHYYPIRRESRQEPPKLQYNVPRLGFAQAPRPTTPRRRYRASQHEHPMYDDVQDDMYGQNEQLDTFDEYMLQQPVDDRRYQASRGLARLSLAPALSRPYQDQMIETHNAQPRMQAQPVNQTARDRREPQILLGEPTRESLDRYTHNTNQPIESSSDVLYGASSSPAFNAGRRRARQYEATTPQQNTQAQSAQDWMHSSSKTRDDESEHHPKDEAFRFNISQNDVGRPYQQLVEAEPAKSAGGPARAAPLVQGIPLVPVSALTDRLRTVFPFPTFNAVQSKCFDRVFKSDNNFVMSSPTGSGKTAILELAICRAVATNSTGQYKVVYQAPTKALCSERQRDWDKKFTQLGLKCAELTGDSDISDLRNVQSANIIITTPEKWDSMTRKWKDHERLMRLVRLFLIDEVHILNENRGAVLEAVVSRMKSISTDVRFVALSATVPNFRDVAAWFGTNSSEPHRPSPSERFGEEFRPIKLRKHVCGYNFKSNNDWAFEKQLDDKLPEIISKYSEKKPMMIFCATRKSCITTARLVADWWRTRTGHDLPWNHPSQSLNVQDKDLRDLVISGVAFHHAGLSPGDRVMVEAGFLRGDISVICCTSTLAVGVNLPCHLVVIKNTMSWTQEGFNEYSDLEMMQMLGRAGRPQFDDSAVAVIMTRQNKVRRYETLVTGQEILESKLHLNLIDHMNAEIGLGTIRDLDSARKWLTSTFMYIRLQQNPTYYKLEGSRSGQSIQEQVDDICFRDINLLREYNLMTGEEQFRCTEFGHAMARYYVNFETMKVFMGLQHKSTLSETLSAVAQAAEFSEIRFRQGEKSLYKAINQSPSIRFPIPVNLDLSPQKVSLIVQSILGHAEISWDGELTKHRSQYFQEVGKIFKSINTLIRCIIDCQIVLGDSVTIQNAMMLERSLGSKAWDDSPMQMIQIPEIGNIAVRKLVNAGIRSIEDLEATDARRIETVVGKNPPFGLRILDALKSYPKLRVSLHVQQASITKTSDGVKIHVSADIGFINERPPERFGNKLIYVCVLAETSDGRKIHFARINGHKLGSGQKLVFPALLTSADQTINCYLMCEGIAGSLRNATVTPKIALSKFPLQISKAIELDPTHKSNMSRRRIDNAPVRRRKSATATSDDYDDADIDDDALANAACVDRFNFEHIDNFANTADDAMTSATVVKTKPTNTKGKTKHTATKDDGDNVPVQLPNGRWLCNHKCKDKEACKHYCCKHGLDKLPKKAPPKRVPTSNHQEPPSNKGSSRRDNKTQTKLQLTAPKRKKSAVIEELDLTQQEKKRKTEYAINGPRDFRDLHKLHKSVQKTEVPSSLHSVGQKKPAYCYGEGGEHQLSFLSQSTATRRKSSSEYGDLDIDEIATDPYAAKDHAEPSSYDESPSLYFPAKAPVTTHGSETFGEDDSMFSDAMVGLADSQDLQLSTGMNETSADMSLPDLTTDSMASKHYLGTQARLEHRKKPTQHRTPFLEATSSPEKSRLPTPAQARLHNKNLYKPLRSVSNTKQTTSASHNKPDDRDVEGDLLDLFDSLPTDNTENIDVKQAEPVPTSHSQPDAAQKTDEEKEQKKVPDNFKDLQPWLFQEFGDLVELVSD